MHTGTSWRSAAMLTLFWSLIAASARAEVADPARLIPPSAIGYVTIENPTLALETLLRPDYYEPLLALKPVDKAVHSPDFARFKQVIGLLEVRLGTSWQNALLQLTGGGVSLAYDPQLHATILLVKSDDAALLGKLHEAVVDLTKAHAASRGGKSPLESKEHRGVRTWTFGGGEHHAILGNTLVITDKGEALRAVLDLHADSQAQGLTGKPLFQKAREQSDAKDGELLAWAMLDLEALRQVPKVSSALKQKGNKPLVEILLGGVIDAVRTAPYVAASARVDQNKLRLRVELPRDSKQIANSRRWCFSASNSAGAPALLRPKQSVASLTMHRDMAGMWQAREELFDEKVNAGFTQADTNLGLYFSGRDFGPEVLGQFAPRWQFIVARRDFPTSRPVPALKLPAMAVILETKQDAFANELFLTFQNIVGIINLQGIQTGRPQLVIDGDEYHGARIRKASYLATSEAPKEKARVEYNFSPTAAKIGSRFIIGSTYELVRELVDLSQNSSTALAGEQNTLLEVDGNQLRAAFGDNRELLVSRAMLSSGDDRKAAEKQVDSLLNLGRLVQDASLELLAQPKSLTLEATLTLD